MQFLSMPPSLPVFGKSFSQQEVDFTSDLTMPTLDFDSLSASPMPFSFDFSQMQDGPTYSAFPALSPEASPLPLMALSQGEPQYTYASFGVRPSEQVPAREPAPEPTPEPVAAPGRRAAAAKKSRSRSPNTEQSNKAPADLSLVIVVHSPPAPPVVDPDDEVVIGEYSRRVRRNKIAAYLKKRQTRTSNKRVIYGIRKQFADTRPRIGGRFVKLT